MTRSASDDAFDTMTERAGRPDAEPDRGAASSRDDQPAADKPPAAADTRASGDGQPSLVGQVERFRARWESVQIGFVDDPCAAVRQADELVTQVLDDLLNTFQQQRAELEELWNRGDDASTDELRRAFQRHRMFFDRLLSA